MWLLSVKVIQNKRNRKGNNIYFKLGAGGFMNRSMPENYILKLNLQVPNVTRI